MKKWTLFSIISLILYLSSFHWYEKDLILVQLLLAVVSAVFLSHTITDALTLIIEGDNSKRVVAKSLLFSTLFLSMLSLPFVVEISSSFMRFTIATTTQERSIKLFTNLESDIYEERHESASELFCKYDAIVPYRNNKNEYIIYEPTPRDSSRRNSLGDTFIPKPIDDFDFESGFSKSLFPFLQMAILVLAFLVKGRRLENMRIKSGKEPIALSISVNKLSNAIAICFVIFIFTHVVLGKLDLNRTPIIFQSMLVVLAIALMIIIPLAISKIFIPVKTMYVEEKKKRNNVLINLLLYFACFYIIFSILLGISTQALHSFITSWGKTDGIIADHLRSENHIKSKGIARSIYWDFATPVAYRTLDGSFTLYTPTKDDIEKSQMYQEIISGLNNSINKLFYTTLNIVFMCFLQILLFNIVILSQYFRSIRQRRIETNHITNM